MASDLFEQYLVRRGLIEPSKDMNEALLNNEEFLAEIAGIWEGHKPAIEALIKARLYPIERELVQDATPYEVMILRQTMVEVAFLYDDFERYAQEYNRRKKPEPIVGVESEEGQQPEGTTAVL